MKIIITESQKKSINIELQNIIKDDGWETAAKFVGGIDNLKKLVGIKTPMDFLNMFNDLDVVQSKKNPDSTLFKDKNGNNLMVHNNSNVNIDYNNIWSFLGEGFGLDFYETKKLTELWLYDAYNLEGTRTNYYDYSVPQRSITRFTNL
jgi:hypothetical protein